MIETERSPRPRPVRLRAFGGYGRSLLAGVFASLLLVGCEAPTPGGCGARSVTLRNASGLAIEQAYGGNGSTAGWGADLLAGGVLAPGESRAIRLPAAARAVRLVWVNGRAAEMHNGDLCAISGLTLSDRGLQPQ